MVVFFELENKWVSEIEGLCGTRNNNERNIACCLQIFGEAKKRFLNLYKMECKILFHAIKTIKNDGDKY